MIIKSSEFLAKLDLTTVRTAVETGAERFTAANLFFGHGTASAIDEAAYFVSFALGCSPIIPECEIEAVLTETQRDIVLELFSNRISKKIPAAYITHEAWFASYQFYVDERVLVPRSPIAELITDKFSPWVNWSYTSENCRDRTILDMCTGSGCIGIAAALQFPDIKVHASDVSDDALKVAKINIENYELFNRVTLMKSNIFDEIVPFQYDLIVSNPPYVDALDMSKLQDEFLAEPQLGLEAGSNGLDIVIPMLRDAGRYLKDDGVIIVEVGNSASALQQMFPQVAFTWLEFEYGGDGVFLLEADELRKYQHLFINKC